MKMTEEMELPHVGFDLLGQLPSHENVDVIDGGIAIFDTIDDLPLNYYPTRVQAAVMAVVLSGRLRLTINLHEYTVGPHNLILLMPNQIVQTIERSDDFDGVYIAISPEKVKEITSGVQSNLNTFLYSSKNPVSAITKEEEDVLMEYHAFIWKQIKKKDNVYHQRISNYLMLSLVLEIMNIVNRHRPLVKQTKTRKEELFERFLREVSEHFQQHRSVSFYADAMCITPKYLSALSKSLTGITASDWIDRCVILEAKALLKTSTYTIQEVSERLCFPNQSFFGKYFKHHVGCSPKDYRSGKFEEKCDDTIK